MHVRASQMTSDDLLPKGEKLRRAIRWLDENGEYSAAAIQEASVRFDLSSREEQFLLEHFRARSGQRGESGSEYR